jgi:hypothetical protein
MLILLNFYDPVSLPGFYNFGIRHLIRKWLLFMIQRALSFFTFTSNWISRLFFYGLAFGEIEKMRSIFFQSRKSRGVPVTQPAGCGGKNQ